MTSAKGNLNFDVVWITPQLVRLYILQGTTLYDIIPFGNGYSVDFDANMNVLAFRHHHQSYLLMENHKEIESLIHSHLKDNPFMTATDVCNYLLYGRDLYGILSFTVVSDYLGEKLMMYFTQDITLSAFYVNDK